MALDCPLAFWQEWKGEFTSLLRKAEDLKLMLHPRRAHYLTLVAHILHCIYRQDLQEDDWEGQDDPEDPFCMPMGPLAMETPWGQGLSFISVSPEHMDLRLSMPPSPSPDTLTPSSGSPRALLSQRWHKRPAPEFLRLLLDRSTSVQRHTRDADDVEANRSLDLDSPKSPHASTSAALQEDMRRSPGSDDDFDALKPQPRDKVFDGQPLQGTPSSYSSASHLDCGGLCPLPLDQLHQLCLAVYFSSCLKTVTLTDCGLGDEAVEHLASVLPASHSLRTLDLSHNKCGDQGVHALAVAIHENCSIKHLGLSHNLITDEGVLALTRALGSNRRLKMLDLTHNHLGNESCLQLCVALHHNTTLSDVRLQDGNHINNERLVRLMTKLANRNKSIKDYIRGLVRTRKDTRAVA